jgi:hypothetical protein
VQADQVVLGDIDERIKTLQRSNHFLVTDFPIPGLGFGSFVPERWIAAPAKERIEADRNSYHEQRIEQNGLPDEGISERMNLVAADDSRERRGASGRVDALALMHHSDGNRHRTGRGEFRNGDVSGAKDTNRRRSPMARQHRPRLGQLAMGHRK